MGFAIAETFAELGAQVTLITGPVKITASYKNISRVDVVKAEEMFEACMKHSVSKDIIVMCAAVADYTPVETLDKKIKKKTESLSIELKPTKDILGELGKRKKSTQLLIGFALETDNELANAKIKLKKKNLDFIVLNSLSDKGAGFGVDTNKIAIIDSNNKITNFELNSKKHIAEEMINFILEQKKMIK